MKKNKTPKLSSNMERDLLRVQVQYYSTLSEANALSAKVVILQQDANKFADAFQQIKQLAIEELQKENPNATLTDQLEVIVCANSTPLDR